MPAVNATSHNPELGIADLPEASSGLIMGATYGLVVDNPPSRYPLMSSLIRDTWQKGLPTTLITPADPASLIQRLSALDFASLPPALERNEVRLLQTQGDIAKKMFRYGGSRLVRELRYFGVPENSLLIFDQADDLFSLHDLSLALNQLEAVKTWATAANVAVLLMFSGITVSSTYQSTLSGMLDQLAGMARIETEGDVLSFGLEFWKSVGGAVTHQRFELETLPSGIYRVARHQAKTSASIANTALPAPVVGTSVHTAQVAHATATYATEPAGHQRTFFYESSRLERLKRSIDGEWHKVEGLAGLLRASRSVAVPYIVLRFGADTDLRSLAEMVNVLRSSRDALAKIIVIEDDASLRYRNEVLLLRLGASLVIQRDTPDIRVPLLMESLVGQVFRGDQAIDFDAALGSVLDVPHKGYLAPALFVSEVMAGLERSAILNTPVVLVSIKIESDASAFDLLRSSSFIRTGDLATASPWEILLFLPGCPEAFVPRILANSFPSHARLASRWDVGTETHRDRIRAQINGFKDLIPADYADISGYLASDNVPPSSVEHSMGTVPALSRLSPLEPTLTNASRLEGTTTHVIAAKEKAEDIECELNTVPLNTRESAVIGNDTAQAPVPAQLSSEVTDTLPVEITAKNTPHNQTIAHAFTFASTMVPESTATTDTPLLADAQPLVQITNVPPAGSAEPAPNGAHLPQASAVVEPAIPYLRPTQQWQVSPSSPDTAPLDFSTPALAQPSTSPDNPMAKPVVANLNGTDLTRPRQSNTHTPAPVPVPVPVPAPAPPVTTQLKPVSLLVGALPKTTPQPPGKPHKSALPVVSIPPNAPASKLKSPPMRSFSMEPLKATSTAQALPPRTTQVTATIPDAWRQQSPGKPSDPAKSRAVRVQKIQRNFSEHIAPTSAAIQQDPLSKRSGIARTSMTGSLFLRNKTLRVQAPIEQPGLFASSASKAKSHPSTQAAHSGSNHQSHTERTAVGSPNTKGRQQMTTSSAPASAPVLAPAPTPSGAGRAIRVSSASIHEHRSQLRDKPDGLFNSSESHRPKSGRQLGSA